MTDWRKVEDELPDEDNEDAVLVSGVDGVFRWYDLAHPRDVRDQDVPEPCRVTHWAPIDEVPE